MFRDFSREYEDAARRLETDSQKENAGKPHSEYSWRKTYHYHIRGVKQVIREGWKYRCNCGAETYTTNVWTKYTFVGSDSKPTVTKITSTSRIEKRDYVRD